MRHSAIKNSFLVFFSFLAFNKIRASNNRNNIESNDSLYDNISNDIENPLTIPNKDICSSSNNKQKSKLFDRLKNRLNCINKNEKKDENSNQIVKNEDYQVVIPNPFFETEISHQNVKNKINTVPNMENLMLELKEKLSKEKDRFPLKSPETTLSPEINNNSSDPMRKSFSTSFNVNSYLVPSNPNKESPPENSKVPKTNMNNSNKYFSSENETDPFKLNFQLQLKDVLSRENALSGQNVLSRKNALRRENEEALNFDDSIVKSFDDFNSSDSNNINFYSNSLNKENYKKDSNSFMKNSNNEMNKDNHHNKDFSKNIMKILTFPQNYNSITEQPINSENSRISTFKVSDWIETTKVYPSH